MISFSGVMMFAVSGGGSSSRVWHLSTVTPLGAQPLDDGSSGVYAKLIGEYFVEIRSPAHLPLQKGKPMQFTHLHLWKKKHLLSIM